jgi:hypothetical protein
MLYIKSAAVGIVMLVAATIAYIVVATVIFYRRYTPPPGAEISFDLRSLLTSPTFWASVSAVSAVSPHMAPAELCNEHGV